ncbi:thioesterase II family protein [Peribacillus butanolivorans]|uniref:thioesterase II family protein n=1 Tax=Peribacillus butanolivorans TaxID=421767 RepID=UPI0036D92039
MNKIKVFAFPYAFGGSNIYQELGKQLDRSIQMKPLDYAGHGARMFEGFSNSIQEMAQDAYARISNELNDDYCLLGYSMGGYVCYELYQIIKKNNKRLPLHMFMFASKAPDFKKEDENGECMSLEQVRNKLREINGTPEEILNNDELIEMIAPVIRSDISNISNYIPTNYTIGKIDCQTTVIRGLKERDENCHAEWSKYFNNDFEYLTVNGGHFFMFENDFKRTTEFAEIINERVRKYIYSKKR